ncbi:hypothetical protein F5X68DRAFT_226622 [Plectosphaerella plurivora]|uniref:Fe2OG dioxygenase domain-containing protein n=1 Tax=Plectosphaerella plurivora TaxID=936078 RepID=A0A9P9AH21_9PEZI|nr:hypothetical protein F5X68DRAFT_226622 [Plectosphaerella plurivora]
MNDSAMDIAMDIDSPMDAGILSGEPPVWAEKRQALCDALPYFKSHQGSLYTSKLVAKGILIDGELSIRDILTQDVIITALGGGRVKSPEGKMTRTREASSTLFKSATAAMQQGLPVGVVAGEKYSLIGAPVPHAYNVLGWFTITDMWAERDADDIVLHKLRLEKTDKSAPSWWALKGSVPQTVGERSYPAVRRPCKSCQEESKQVFAQGWACLNPICRDHFVLPDGEIISDLEYAADNAAPLAWCMDCMQPSKTIFAQGWTCLRKECSSAFEFPQGIDKRNLTYSQEILMERTACVASTQPIRPDLPVFEQASTSIEFRCGIVCPQCHGCSRRRDWDRWVCETDGCDFVYHAPPELFTLADVGKEVSDAQMRKTFKNNFVRSPNVESFSKKFGVYSVEGFSIKDPSCMTAQAGTVHVFRATDKINSRAGGADQMWHEIHDAAGRSFTLSRNPVRTPGHKTEVLTRHFQQNWGAPYKFVVNVLSKSFSDAPDFILRALMRMSWAGHKAVWSNRGYQSPPASDDELDGLTPFNELLSLGYMEGDCISYHDDGEGTLGPTVATMSLGSPALMSFRMKKKVAKDEREVLKLPIYHGDIVVMHGEDIHKYFEHKVDPLGKRRFALTSRYIDLDTLDPVTREEAEKKGAIPGHAIKWAYDGQ